MTGIHELTSYTDELLETAGTPDYPAALNGLQLENRSGVKGIAAAVDFSTRAIKGAIEAAANLLIVHHGMFWSGFDQIRGPSYERLRLLIENDIAVYSSHLPLDRHPTFGNNVLLAKALGLTPTGAFAQYDDIFIGVSGESDIETAVVAENARQFASTYSSEVRLTPLAPHQRTRKWAMCTGAGASSDTLKEAARKKIDTLIVGEGPHHTAVQAEETGITIIYAGHYATETLGVRALAKHLGEKYGVPSTFVNAPTGL
ncbi:MAG TPA: Nif3-like dinuclear metal center hexameric protein [Gemmatimonadaceae bacterium]|nr:Nif3-like dinuclear metal center hexameric protein [Gemmatimonadaceae bacterium]